MSQEIKTKIKQYPQENQLPCAVAHYIAAEVEVSPKAVGDAANELEVRITQCQLGLFGYAQKGQPAYRILRPMEPLPEALAQAMGEAAVDGRVACAKLWQVAEQFGLSRHEIGNAADTLELKVKPCQLGCF
ncbi:MAG: hypothetical protein JW934_11795 [Anaerolineae bacterium]|nr:hypothetical protein [Anaerolineae bacterium]